MWTICRGAPIIVASRAAPASAAELRDVPSMPTTTGAAACPGPRRRRITINGQGEDPARARQTDPATCPSTPPRPRLLTTRRRASPAASRSTGAGSPASMTPSTSESVPAWRRVPLLPRLPRPAPRLAGQFVRFARLRGASRGGEGRAGNVNALCEDGLGRVPQPAALHALDRAELLGEHRPDPGVDHPDPVISGGGIFRGPPDGVLRGLRAVVAHGHRCGGRALYRVPSCVLRVSCVRLRAVLWPQ